MDVRYVVVRGTPAGDETLWDSEDIPPGWMHAKEPGLVQSKTENTEYHRIPPWMGYPLMVRGIYTVYKLREDKVSVVKDGQSPVIEYPVFHRNGAVAYDRPESISQYVQGWVQNYWDGRRDKGTPLNRESVMTLRYGTTLHHRTEVGSDGSPVRCRMSGAVKTWKTRPDDWEFPVKYGLRGSFRIDNHDRRNAEEWYIPE